MPKSTFFRLPEERRARLVHEAIVEFADRTYAEASLSQIARRANIPKGSVYQYFEDKLDLYRWLLTEEAPRLKREFVGKPSLEGDFWTRLEDFIERGMAFLVEHPRLARLSAAAADPTANPEVRGLHKAICEAGIQELRAVLEAGADSGALHAPDLDVATRFVATIIGPGLTDVVLKELGAELHEVLASDSLRKRLGPKRRRALAQKAVHFIRKGLGSEKPQRGKEA
ncbi:TetR/AcrR family transcriptional regulator [Polyangium jinanense]|uniref:TetR/AcrR family transcriptional regulator n=1 Tax=Polyangium jinanense TaxID=2829994 RepID=A0A9X3X033_9BACT|nr:TetR/AcrR family transcriptional regulator [Polyangium jinanense]MDC3955311.1 TetR/AcrR family transcriptional regulator [Polyangium jinanense]MDC3981612.1 TetR/AcrR family transcriptional regulator [Polyangium jinanense]